MDVIYKEVFNLDELVFEMVIDALNKYFANNKRDTSFIEVRKNGDVYRFSADDLIAWLRTEHGIFYYPGMEAKYAKTERIPPLTERLMDEGALNSLKKLHKRVTGEEPEVDSHTLIADGIAHQVSVYEVQIEELKEELNNLKDTVSKVRSRLNKMFCPLGYEDDLENVTDIALRAVEARNETIKELRDELKEAKTSGTSDVNKLISDYCNKNDITPPSPYFDEASCVEYLFSVVDLERKHRAAVGKQMVDDYEKDLLQFIYKEYRDRTRLSDETITYNPPNICNTITKIISDYARSRNRIDTLETRIKYIYDKYKTKFVVDDYVLDGDPTSSFMLDCIGSWIDSSTELKQECDFLKDDLGKEAVIREFLNRRSKTRAKLGTIEKKLEELLKDVKEELP